MKKILTVIVIGVLLVLGLPFILLFASEVTGIGSKDGGYKVYKVQSPFKEGQDFIQNNKIKCIATEVETEAFIDISRGKTFFAYNVDHNNYYFLETIKYVTVPDDLVKQYRLYVHFSWLETYGKYIVNSMFGICVFIGLVVWWIGRD